MCIACNSQVKERQFKKYNHKPKYIDYKTPYPRGDRQTIYLSKEDIEMLEKL